MIDKINIDETIELFVKGKLSEPALSEFKDLMFEDKSIASEVRFQRLTTDAIKESRKLALKSRLEAINVTNIGNGSNAPSTFAKYFSFKSVGIALATIGVGASSYLFTQSQIDSANDSNISNNQNLIQDSITQVMDADANSDFIASSEEVTVSENIETKASNLEVAVQKVENRKKSEISNKKKLVTANGEAMLDQKFDDGAEVNISAQNPQMPTTNTTEEKALHASDVDIKNVQDGKYNFHYMLKESTLFLYGNFDASPYEILEFNEKEEQSFYLYYDQSFFSLKSAQTEPIKLKKISEAKLLQSLIEARNKKH
jgi:hypothetical protein